MYLVISMKKLLIQRKMYETFLQMIDQAQETVGIGGSPKRMKSYVDVSC